MPLEILGNVVAEWVRQRKNGGHQSRRHVRLRVGIFSPPSAATPWSSDMA